MTEARSVRQHRNQIGQVMGRKGQDTRARLVAAAQDLIATRSLRDLRAADIARAAGLGASHYYVYFPDVGAAVLAALEEHPQSSPEVLALLDRDWTAGSGYEHAKAFVAAYLDSWRVNFALLRARNLAADEGDARFVAQRTSDIGPILRGLTVKFESAMRSGQAPGKTVHAAAAAGVVLAALERLAAAPRWGDDGKAHNEEVLREAAAYVLAAALGLKPRGL